MANKVAWIKIEEWEFQEILKEIAEDAKTGAHAIEKKNSYTRVSEKPKLRKFNSMSGLASTFAAQNLIGS